MCKISVIEAASRMWGRFVVKPIVALPVNKESIDKKIGTLWKK